jgi:nicotinamidase-related amidase
MSETLPPIDPQNSALLVMDYQPGIIGMLADSEPLVTRMAAALEKARAAGLRICYVRVAFADEDYAAIPATNKSFSRFTGQPGFLHADLPETNVAPAVAPQPSDIIVRKKRVGAFSTTTLAEQLREHGVDTLILAGISTSGVVLSTVRDAADQDFCLFVLSDCCADPDPEVHEVLMNKVFPRQAYVISAAEFARIVTP